LAVHEVFLSKDGAPIFNPKGVPYSLCFRRMLEECSTVAEAEKLLRSTERTTLLSLAVCDLREAAVFEMTPKTVAVRRPDNGLLFCTNHFRTPELMMFAWCGRYRILEKSQSLKILGLEDVAKKLDEVNMGRLTVQTMIFEPKPLILHLAIGASPSSALPLKKLELQPLFKRDPTFSSNRSSKKDDFYNQPMPPELILPDTPPTARSMDVFKRIKPTMSMEEVVRLCGLPDQHTGSGIYIFIYKLDDGSQVAIGTGDLKQLLYIRFKDGKGEDYLEK
jgi:hypothetical protein